jgi:hypothetical protein
MQLKDLLAGLGEERSAQTTAFATITLGVVELLANGSMSAADAVRTYFNADNCLYVKKRLKVKLADRVMSHGVQLPDLFDCLTVEEAQREFLHELAAIKALCIKLIESQRLAA